VGVEETRRGGEGGQGGKRKGWEPEDTGPEGAKWGEKTRRGDTVQPPLSTTAVVFPTPAWPSCHPLLPPYIFLIAPSLPRAHPSVLPAAPVYPPPFTLLLVSTLALFLLSPASTQPPTCFCSHLPAALSLLLVSPLPHLHFYSPNSPPSVLHLYSMPCALPPLSCFPCWCPASLSAPAYPPPLCHSLSHLASPPASSLLP
jgi:hypothetical protein